MGYDLHITRRRRWDDEGSAIPADEWLAFAQADPELHAVPEEGPYFFEWRSYHEHDATPWFDWRNGVIHTKNPDPATIDRMVAIAATLGAVVQGDDGEVYTGGDAEPVEPPLSLKEKLAIQAERLAHGLRTAFRPRPVMAAPFRVGERAHDTIIGMDCTVTSVDPEAEHGMGILAVRLDDGRERRYTCVGHPLAPTHGDAAQG